MQVQEVIRDTVRLLTFKGDRALFQHFGRTHLAAGLVGTWLAGVGRYWDHPEATLPQHLGAGSVVYVFVLSAFLLLIIAPYRVPGMSYRRLLTFVSLTSFPALLYAIPVERFTSVGTAASINAWFLAVVAIWRLALLYMFIRRAAGLPHVLVTTLTLLPMAIIVTALAFLNLEHAVFEIMGGIREDGPHDKAYVVVLGLTVVSWALLPVLLILYIGGMVYLRRKRIRHRSPESV